jgi:transcriptional regulator with XRE-family HTH domain
MPAKHVPASHAVGRFLKAQRQRMGYTLREVEHLSQQAGKLIPFSTLARIEQGKLDPGLRRLQQLLAVYHVPIQAAGDLLDLEEYAGDLPKEKDPKKLYKIGKEAWDRRDVREGVAAFLAIQLLGPDVDALTRQKAVLGLSTAAANLGKFQFAKHIVDGLLLEPPDESLVTMALLQAARCWQWLGSYEVALALTERARARLTRASPAYDRAFVHHQIASVFTGMKRYDEAEQELDVALQAYRQAKDEAGFARGLASRIRIGFDRGKPGDALLAAQAARLYAQRHGIDRLRLLFSIEEARAYLAVGNVRACLSRLGEVLADSADLDDAFIRFYLHYYFWRAHETLGDDARAKVELDAAARHVESVDEVTPETTHMRALISRQARPKGKRPLRD